MWVLFVCLFVVCVCVISVNPIKETLEVPSVFSLGSLRSVDMI